MRAVERGVRAGRGVRVPVGHAERVRREGPARVGAVPRDERHDAARAVADFFSGGVVAEPVGRVAAAPRVERGAGEAPVLARVVVPRYVASAERQPTPTRPLAAQPQALSARLRLAVLGAGLRVPPRLRDRRHLHICAHACLQRQWLQGLHTHTSTCITVTVTEGLQGGVTS